MPEAKKEAAKAKPEAKKEASAPSIKDQLLTQQKINARVEADKKQKIIDALTGKKK